MDLRTTEKVHEGLIGVWSENNKNANEPILKLTIRLPLSFGLCTINLFSQELREKRSPHVHAQKLRKLSHGQALEMILNFGIRMVAKIEGFWGDKCFCLPTGVIKPDEVLHFLLPPFYLKMILINSHTQLSSL